VFPALPPAILSTGGVVPRALFPPCSSRPARSLQTRPLTSGRKRI